MASLLETVANADHPIVEGELPFFGFRFEGLVPPVVPRATAAIRKRAKLLFLVPLVRAGVRFRDGVEVEREPHRRTAA